MKFNRTDKSILFLAIAIILVFSYFLYDDSFLFRGRESRNLKIGNIKQAENDVRLRASDSFTWNAAKRAEVVFERDSVFTGKRSQTQIDLIDGSRIFLNENSLVTLVTKNGSLELNLRYGNIKTEINPSSKLQLKSGSQKIIINKDAGTSTLEIKKPKYGLTKVKLISGKATVKHSANPEVQTLVKDQPIVIKPSGTVQKVAPGVITLNTPHQAQFFVNSINKSFYLDWHSQSTDKNTLLVSKTKDLKSPVVTENDIKTKYLVKELPPGTYFWTVSGVDAGGTKVQTEVRSFSVVLLEKLAFVEPKEGQKIEVEIKGDITTHKEPVKLSWTNIYDTVHLQVSNTPDFASVVFEKELEKVFELNQLYSTGKYFLRIRGKKLAQYSEWSEIRYFEVNVKAKGLVKPEPPILLTKKTVFNTSESRSPSSITPVTIKWKSELQVPKYEFEVSYKDPKFSKPTKLTSKTPQTNFVPKVAGTHYYRVRAISDDNLPSEYSEVGELQTKFNAPKLNAVSPVVLRSDNPDSIAPPVKLKLSWSPVYLANEYTVEVAESKDFENSKKLVSSTNEFTYEVPQPGSFYFRVIASDLSKTTKSDHSNVETSNYTYIKRLPKPTLLEPKNRMTVFLQKEIEPFIWLNWESITGQQTYELEIGLDKTFSKIITRQKLAEAKFLIKTKLPLGKIYWRVRQLDQDPNRISDWTEIREFQLLSNKNEGVFK